MAAVEEYPLEFVMNNIMRASFTEYKINDKVYGFFCNNSAPRQARLHDALCLLEKGETIVNYHKNIDNNGIMEIFNAVVICDNAEHIIYKLVFLLAENNNTLMQFIGNVDHL